MCKHIHKKDYFNHMSNTCTIQTWYEQSDTTSMTYPDLPHDGKGLCIFHSKDKKWKRDNHCGERFTELFQAMSEDDNLMGMFLLLVVVVLTIML